VCCFHSVCLFRGSNGGYGLICCDDHCDDGLLNVLLLALVCVFLRMLLLFIILFWLFIQFKKHLWDCKYEILLCSSPM
jgi:hypothetical protein